MTSWIKCLSHKLLGGERSYFTFGCPTNPVEAYKWPALGASQGNKDAHYLVQELELFMTPADLSLAKASVQDFFQNRSRTNAAPASQ